MSAYDWEEKQASLFLTRAAIKMENKKKAKVNIFFSVFVVRCGTLSNASFSVFSIKTNEEHGPLLEGTQSVHISHGK